MTETEVPAWVRRVGAASIALVAIVAAVVSYSHMHTVALRAGEGWRAWLDPLSVDGLLVGTSLVIYVKKRAGWLTWTTLAIGILVSLAANLAAARPDLVSRLASAWPAVALALSYEVLLVLVRQPAAKPTPIADQVPGDAGEEVARAGEEVARAGDDLADAGGDLEARAAALVAAGYGRGRLAEELAISSHQARQLLDKLANRRPALHAVSG